MSNHELSEDAADARHDTPPSNPMFDLPMAGEHIGNDHQAPTGESAGEPTSFFRPAEPPVYDTARRSQMPSRIPGQSLIHPHVREHGVYSFGAGLSWQASVQSQVRADLVSFDFGASHPYENIPAVSNIELRTIYAHLLETAGRVRAEMRERGMQVDL